MLPPLCLDAVLWPYTAVPVLFLTAVAIIIGLLLIFNFIVMHAITIHCAVANSDVNTTDVCSLLLLPVDCRFSSKCAVAVSVTATCVANADIANIAVAPCCQCQLIVAF